MDNQNNSSGSLVGAESPELGTGSVRKPPEELDSLSLDPGQAAAIAADAPVRRGFFRRFVRRLDVIILGLLLLGGAALLGLALMRDEQKPSNAAEASRYGTISLPLDELVEGKNLELPEVTTITINGPMQLNNGLRFAPSTQPNGALPGQLYFDDGTNQLAYYNGNAFVFLGQAAEGVQGIGGLTGQVNVGAGMTTANGQLTNNGVLSLLGQTGNVTLTGGNGINITGTTISSTGLMSLSSGSATLTVTTDANGNAVITSTGAGTGTVSGPGGTVGTIPKFTSAQTIADSLLSESGATVTVNGNLNITGNLSIGSPLPVTSGGIGQTSLANNGVLVGQGAGAILSVTAGGTGECLLSTAGAPAFGACPGGGGGAGVDSLNGLTGALNIANASGAGTTITINDATTATKGIASFNSTNFTVSGGAVNTIQNINSGASPTFAAVNTNTLTPSGAMSLGAITNTALLQGSITTITSTGAGNDIILNAADIIDLLDNTNITGNLDVSGTISSGTANAFQVAANGDITTAGSSIFQGGFATVGTSTQAGVLVLYDGSSNTGTLQLAALGQNTVYTLPDPGQATATICLTTGNCAGSGSGVTSAGGTVGQLARFTGAQAIGDSIVNDNGTVVTIAGALSVNTLTPSAALTVGATTQNAVLQGAVTTVTATAGGITNTLGFAAPSGSNKTITIPNASGTIAVSASGPLSLDANGNLTCAGCVTSGGGSGGVGAVDSLNGLIGALTIANASGAGTTITIDDATTGAKGIASFNSTNFTVTSGAVNTIQDIDVAATPTFAAINTNTITPSGAMTVGAVGQTALLRGSVVTITSNGAGNDIIIDAADVIDLQDNTTIAGDLDVAGALNVGTANALQVTAAGAITSAGNATFQGGSITVGTAAQAGAVVLYDGSSNTATLDIAALGQNTTYTLPDPGQATAGICLTTGNCAGVAGGVNTSGGTAGTIAVFTGAQTIEDSILTQTAGTVTAAGHLNVTSGNQFQINGTQISSAALSNDADLAKLASTQTFTGATNTFSNDVTINGSTILGNADADTLTIGATLQGGTPLTFEGATVDTSQLVLAIAALSGDRTITLPDETGTVCLQGSSNCGFATSSGSGNYVQNGTSLQTANFHIQSANAASVGGIIRGANGQTSSLLQMVDGATGYTVAQFTNNGYLMLGSDNIPRSGQIVIHDNTVTNTFTSTITPVAAFTGNHTITIPDESGTLCFQNSANCGFLTGAATDYIQNGTSVQTSANFAIRSAAVGSVGGLFQGANGQTADILQVQTWNGTSAANVFTIGNTGDLTSIGLALFQSSSVSGFRIQDTTGTDTILNVDTQNQRVGIGGVATVSKLEVHDGEIAAYNNGNNPRLILGDSTTAGQNGFLQWDSTNDYFRIESVGTNGLKVNDNFVAIGNTFPDKPWVIAVGSARVFEVESTGEVVIRTTTDSVTGFQVRQNDADPVFNIDTLNTRVGIGNATPGYALDVTGSINVSSGNTYKINGTDICTSSGCTPAAGSGNYIQNTTTPQTANMSIVSSAAGQIAAHIQGAANMSAEVLVVRAGSSPTNNVFEAQDDDGTQLFAVDPDNNRVIVGSGSGCTGRFCVTQTSGGAGGGTATNSYNLQTVNVSGAGTYVGQNIVVTDTSTAIANVINPLVINTSTTTNTSATINSIGVTIPSNASGTMLRLTNGSTDVTTIANNGAATFRTTAASADAFRILNGSGANVLDVDTVTSTMLANADFSVERTSTQALDISNASSDSLLSVNTTNGIVSIGSGYSGALLVLGSGTSDPGGTPTDGSMFYNATSERFRCHENGSWKNCRSAPLVITIFGQNGGGASSLWDNMPAALTEFMVSAGSPVGNPASRTRVDLTDVDQIRFVVNAETGGATNAEIRLQYSTDQTTWNYIDAANTGLGQNIDVNGLYISSWSNIAAGAKGDVYIRLVGINGDGVNDPRFGLIQMQTR